MRRYRPALEVELAGFRPVLLAAARLLLRSEADAQDLVQTTYELALRHDGELRQPEKLLPWLLRIQTREAYRLRRHLGQVFSRSSDLAHSEPPPDAGLLAIREALAQLPQRERTAVVLHHMVGLSVAETADAMGVSVNTVKAQLKVALSKLREALE